MNGKIASQLFASDVVVDYNDDGGSRLVISLKDAKGNAISGVRVNVAVGGITGSILNNDKGQVYLKVSSLVPGSYVANISFSGNDVYAASSTTANVVVNGKSASQLSANNLSINYGWGCLNATLTDTMGNAIENVDIIVNIGGRTYTLITNNGGEVQLSINDLAPGYYVANISFAGNNRYEASFTTVNVIINKTNTLLAADDLYIGYGGNTSLVATLTDSNGNVIGGVNIYVTFNGKSYNLTTDDEGNVQLLIGALDLGTYIATFNFAENDFYLASSAVSNVFINKASSTWYLMDKHFNYFNYGENSYLHAALKDVYGNPIANVPATVNIVKTFDLGVNENYRTDTYTTDGEGMIYLWVGNIPVGDYFINYNFAGNNHYESSTDYYSMTISKCPTHFLIDNNFGSSVNYQENKVWSIRLIEERNNFDYAGDGVGNANIKVTFTCKGSSQQQYVFNLKTNNEGYATFNTKDMLPGTYDMSVEFLGDDRYVRTDRYNHYDGSYFSGTFSIKKANPTITTTGVTTTYGTEGFVTATLNDPNGNVMANRLVTFTFEDGTGRTVRTDKNGKAQLSTLGVNAGTHTITVTYAPESGSDDYSKYNSVSSSVTMKINKANAVLSAKSGTTWIYRNGQQLNTFYIANKKEKEIQVYLEDQNGNPLVGKSIKFSGHTSSYSSSGKTDSQGIETFKLKYNYMFPYLNPETKYYTETFTFDDGCYTATITVKVGVTTN